MRQTSLRNHILFVVLGLLGFLSLAILVSVWVSTSHSGKNQLKDSLNVGENVLSRVFNNRESLLINSAQVLTDDFGFKSAVASNDDATIVSTLINHGERIDADLIALIDLQGNVSASTHTDITSDQAQGFLSPDKLNETLSYRGTTHWVVIKQKLYQSILVTVDAPTPIAIALIGFKVDQALLGDFDAITQLRTSIQVDSASGTDFVISTLDEQSLAQAQKGELAELSWSSLTFLNSTYVSKKFTLAESDNEQIQVVLSVNVAEHFSSFRQLQTSIISIGLGTILFAFAIALLLSKRITQPISRLVNIAQDIASGAYKAELINSHGVTEVEDLSKSIQLMQSNVQNREEEIRFQAEHDVITGLYNRAHISMLVDKQMQEHSFVAVGITLRGFRQINDTFGLENGDRSLAEIAKRITFFGGQSARISESAFLWLPDSNVDEHMLNHRLEALHEQITLGSITINPKLTLVYLNCPLQANNADTLLRRLNIGFDEASKNHKSLVAYHNDFEQHYLRRLQIVSHLKLALSDVQSELSMVYQPKLHLASNKVRKVEALIRWHSSELGFVPPDEFIEIAEQANLINQLTRWVLLRVITDLKEMRKQHKALCAAINLSAKDIMHPELLPWIMSQLAEHNLPASALSFEITESDLVSDAQVAAKHMQEYRDCGFDLAIDDFGTGYSSLAYLQQLPVSEIKIDKSFVLNLSSNKADQKIVKHIIHLAASFNLDVIAEGVEDEHALSLLREYGSQWAQGFHMSRPLALVDLISWLSKQESVNKGSILDA